MSHETVRKGSKGQAVAAATSALVKLGYLESPTDVFGVTEAKAVRLFQARNIGPNGRPLTVDGIVGPLTWWSLTTADQSTAFARSGQPSEGLLVEEMEVLRKSGTLPDTALLFAYEELMSGAREIGGNNRGKFVAKYHRVSEDKLTNKWAWCAAYTSWCWKQAATQLGVGMPFRYSGGARAIMNGTISRESEWEYHRGLDGYTPVRGDLVFWWRDNPSSWKGHVGIVASCEDGVVRVIEGNRGRYPSYVKIYSYTLESMSRLLGFSHYIGE